MRVVDLVGRKFNFLLVVSRAENSAHGQTRWNCVCDCGRKVVISSSNLRNKTTKSCGCYRKDHPSNRLRPYESTYRILVKRSRGRGWKKIMSYKVFVNFTKTVNCYYCGDPIVWELFQTDGSGPRPTNLDRVDSAKGYSKSNCVVCCFPCNQMKMDRSRTDFLERIRRIYARHCK